MTSIMPNHQIDNVSIKDRLKTIANNDKQYSHESVDEFSKRNLGQNTARSLETIAGFPGNFKKAFLQSRDMIEDFFKEKGLINQTLKDTEKNAFKSFQPSEGSLDYLTFNPPTSSELREGLTKDISEKLTGDREYFEPKNKAEQAAGELTQDITSFFLPGTGQMRLATRLGAPILGSLIKQGLKYLGSNEETADKAKMGVMLMTSLAGQSDPGRFASNRIAQAKEMIPETATVNVTNLANRLMPLYNRVTRGLRVPSKSRSIQGMRDLADQVQNNRMSLRSLMDARDNVNEWIAEAGGWDVPAPTRDASIRNLNELKTQIIRSVDEALTQRFPEAAELYRTGYEAAAVTHQSNAISRFIEKNFGRKAASVGAKVLFPALAGSGLILPKTAAAGAAALPFYKAGQVLYRVGNSPTLARYYMEVIRSATVGNILQMVKNMKKLDSGMKKQEDEESNKSTVESFKSKFKKKG